jgi:hypothetical protein
VNDRYEIVAARPEAGDPLANPDRLIVDHGLPEGPVVVAIVYDRPLAKLAANAFNADWKSDTEGRAPEVATFPGEITNLHVDGSSPTGLVIAIEKIDTDQGLMYRIPSDDVPNLIRILTRYSETHS